MPGLPSVQSSTQGWASVGSMWSTSLNEAWLPEWKVGSTGGFTVPCSPSSSGYIFSSSGDGTTGSGNGFYALGRAVRVVQGASTIYGPVATASVAAGVTTVGLSSSLATAALSTATAFTSVAVGTESGHSLAGSSGLGATKFHREDGTWAPPTGGGDFYNFLTNPGFEVWQRGAGAFTADGAYTADRWLMDEVGTDTLSVTREGTTKSTNSLYSLAAVFVLGNGAGATQIYQQLSINVNDENHQLLGQAISARIAVRTATATAARVFIATDGTGGTTNYSGYHTGGSTFENLDVTNITVPSDATYVRVGVAFAASATVYMDNASFAISATAPTYKGLARSEEWGRCQRYYETHGESSADAVGNFPSLMWYTADTADHVLNVPFNTPKAVAPTVTKNGTWQTAGVGAQPTVGQGAKNGYSLVGTGTANGNFVARPNSADDTVTAESNP